MLTDTQGCSTCPPGEEQYDEYFSPTLKKDMVQYDYRAPDEELFSCVAPDLETARTKRDKWMLEREIQ